MNEVTVSRLDLLDKIKANRTSHRDIFLKAQEGYRKKVIEELDLMLKEAREGKPIRRSIQLPEPQDHTEDYNLVIEMLDMELDSTVVISAREFEMYVRDKWAWSEIANFTNSHYTSTH